MLCKNIHSLFVQKAGEGGMVEVDLGQLVLKKAEAQEVRNYAKMVVDDYKKGELTCQDLRLTSSRRCKRM